MIIRTRTCSATYTRHTWQTWRVATKWLSALLQWTYFCFSSFVDKFTQTGAASFPKTNTHTHTGTWTHIFPGSGWVGWVESANIALPSTNKNSTASVWCKRLTEPRMRWCLLERGSQAIFIKAIFYILSCWKRPMKRPIPAMNVSY